MPVDKKLLQILRCPVTKQSLSVLDERRLDRLNDRIRAGEVQYLDGSAVTDLVPEALITENQRTIYRVDDDIPIMLEDRSISTDQFDDY